MRTSKMSLVLGLVLLVACSDSPVNESRSADERARMEAEVQIAVIRHMIDEGGDDLSNSAPKQDVVCVNVSPGGDPSAAVLEAFKDREPPVRPNSECGSVHSEVLPWVVGKVHTPTGRPAIEYGLSRISNPEARRVSVEIGFFTSSEDGHAGSPTSWVCSVQKTGSEWQVESCTAATAS